jgi:hypothetical protein
LDPIRKIVNRNRRRAAGALLIAVMAAACETSKSSTPLSPSVAGPIPGVNITAPKMLEPAANARIANDKQPVTLLIENASTNGVRPLTYIFEIAVDAAFTSKVYEREGISPGDGGRTSLRLPDALQSSRTYFWRARAIDGANSGPYAATMGFEVYTPIVIDAPVPVSPAPNSTVSSVRPRVTVTNARRTGPAGTITYLFEIADGDAFTNKVATGAVAEQPNQTGFDSPVDLAFNKVYYWHARAYDATTLGPWSGTLAFATPLAPVVAPPPSGGTPLPPNASDGIDLRSVIIIKGPSGIASWPVGSDITSVDQGNGQLCINHTQLGRWPSVPFFGDAATLVEGNQWVFMQKNGQWYGGAADWYRPGQACKGIDANSIGRDAFYGANEEPLHSWVPQPGELYGLMSTTPARAWPDMKTLDQRTNIVTVRWR